MVRFFFFDHDGRSIDAIDASDYLPDKVARIKMEGPFDINTSSCKLLISMLEKSPKRLEEITVSELSAYDSPKFLSFLVLICNKASSLKLYHCSLSTNATCCLLAALQTHNGIRSFRIVTGAEPMPANQAQLLFQGIAKSPCLESFDLRVVNFESNHDVLRRDLVEALRENQSLKNVRLLTSPLLSGRDSNFFPNLLKALVLGKNVNILFINDSYGQLLPLDVLQEVLCQKDCTLKKLHLEGLEVSTRGRLDESIIQNVTVKSLTMRDAPYGNDYYEFAEIISLFKSLVELDLSGTCIEGELSFLDPLLLGKDSQLKSLNVSHNEIGEQEMRQFMEKLREIKCLKHLSVGDVADSVKTSLTDALKFNTDLEYVDFDRTDIRLDLNRGGRRLFESSKPLPMNLLPRVLERASKISYYNGDPWGKPTNKKPRKDVVFWMIQRIVPELCSEEND